jgi:hypothetical protein
MEQLLSLVGRGRVRPHLGEGKNAGAHPGKKTDLRIWQNREF